MATTAAILQEADASSSEEEDLGEDGGTTMEHELLESD